MDSNDEFCYIWDVQSIQQLNIETGKLKNLETKLKVNKMIQMMHISRLDVLVFAFESSGIEIFDCQTLESI